MLKDISPLKKKIIELLDHKNYKFGRWLFSIILFFLICYTGDSNIIIKSVLLFLLNIVILIDRSTTVIIYKYKFINLHLFTVY
jgi:hypothetical protein